MKIRQDDQEEPLLFAQGEVIWLQNRRRKKGESNKLQQKFVGPYHVVEAYSNHMYKIERQGQSSVQNELRLKLYHSCTAEPGIAPVSLEARRRPNMRGAMKQRERGEMPEGLDIPVDFPPIPEPATETTPEPDPPTTEPVAEPAAETEPVAVPPEPTPPVTTDRYSRVTRKPITFGDYECYPCEVESEDAEITTECAQQMGKMPPQGTETGPAASRVSLSPRLG